MPVTTAQVSCLPDELIRETVLLLTRAGFRLQVGTPIAVTGFTKSRTIFLSKLEVMSCITVNVSLGKQ